MPVLGLFIILLLLSHDLLTFAVCDTLLLSHDLLTFAVCHDLFTAKVNKSTAAVK